MFYLIQELINDHIRLQTLQVDPSPLSRDYFPFPFFINTARTASLNKSFKPSWVSALTYIYLHLNSYSTTFLAVSLVMGAFFGSVMSLEAASLRSILFPTKIFTAPGTAASISGYHYIDPGLLWFWHY